MGIDNRKLYAVAFGIAMIFTAIAGVLFAIRTIFDPASGPIRLILAFEAVIIGGLGNIWGCLLYTSARSRRSNSYKQRLSAWFTHDTAFAIE